MKTRYLVPMTIAATLTLTPAVACSTELGGGGYGGTLLKTVVSLGVILSLIFVVARFVLPRLGLAAGPTRQLEKVATLPLSRQHALHLVRVGDEHLLVGCSESGVALVKSVDGLPADAEPGASEDGA